MEKNKDTLAVSLTNSLEASTNKFVSEIFTLTRKAMAAAASPSKRGGASKPTIAKRFKANLDTLMTSLNSTTPHFVRCVKSNSKQKPLVFEAPLCLRQLKYAGLFEAIRIRKSGYAYRFNIDYFVRKYYLCCEEGKGLDDKAYAEAIMKEMVQKANGEIGGESRVYGLLTCNADTSLYNVAAANPAAPFALRPVAAQNVDWAVGKTKVFIKSRKPRMALETIRNAAISKHVVKIQSFFRMGLAKIQTFAAKYEEIKKKKEALKKKRELAERKKLEQEKRRIQREEREAEERKKREEEERRIAELKAIEEEKVRREAPNA